MNAEDTVMNDKELNEAFDGDFGEVSFDHKPTAEDVFLIKLRLVAKAQAEPSFKLGIREVVEWIEKEFGYFTDEGLGMIVVDDDGYYGRKGSLAKWQAKRKEWGL